MGYIVLSIVGILLIISQWILIRDVDKLKDEAGINTGYDKAGSGSYDIKTCPNCGAALP